MKRKKKIKQNTEKIKNKFKDFNESNLNGYVKIHLSNYNSDALRITQYYGNLRIKYISFNFTLNAFFISFLSIYLSQILNLNPSLWFTGLPIIIGFFSYLIYFIISLLRSYKTISFEHKNLRHYSSILAKEDYPKIKDKHLNDFIDLIKKEKGTYSIINDLKTLILQYLYQANYQRVGLKMKICLLFGFVTFILTVSISLVWNFLILLPLIPKA